MATPFPAFQTTGQYSFMTCTIQVNTGLPGWEKTVRSVLSRIHGVRSFKMDEYGFIEVSGLVHPELLIRKLAKVSKRAVLHSMRYEDCSSNLYGLPNMPIRNAYPNDHPYYNTAGLYGNHLGGYGSAGYYGHNFFDDGYGRNRPFARLAHELRQRRAPPPPPFVPRHTVYVPRYIDDNPGCCSLM